MRGAQLRHPERMSHLKILMSNIAYARGFDGALGRHVGRAYRHVYCSKAVQQNVMGDVKRLLDREKPDVCCFVEVERGGKGAKAFDQLRSLLDERFMYSDIANKYFAKGRYKWIPVLGRKCNAFCANRPLEFEHVYLDAGIKRLVYQITVNPKLTLFFAHFSLRRKVRKLQFESLAKVLQKTPGEHLVMGDFNVFGGPEEIAPFLGSTGLEVLNDPKLPTFRFHRRRSLVDLAMVSPSLRHRAELRIVEQPYSDHAALILDLHAVKIAT